MVKRPLGVTIVCFLELIFTIYTLIIGIPELISLAGLVWTGGIFFQVLSVLTIVGILLLGTAILLIVYKLWKMQKQGWTWMIVLQGISLILSLAIFDAIRIILSGIIIGYLWKIKGLFK